MRWTIYIGDYAQHSVIAEDEDSAIDRWCDEQGWESPDAAAQEYEGMTGEDVYAVPEDHHFELVNFYEKYLRDI